MQREAIYKGATRPAMKFGVPLVPLVVLFGSGMLVTLWGGVCVSWWTAPWSSPQRSHAGLDALRHPARRPALPADLPRDEAARADRNRSFWHARSYAPYLYRGGRDAWHR
jgi:type IV secretion system protein VirB3